MIKKYNMEEIFPVCKLGKRKGEDKHKKRGRSIIRCKQIIIISANSELLTTKLRTMSYLIIDPLKSFSQHKMERNRQQ